MLMSDSLRGLSIDLQYLNSQCAFEEYLKKVAYKRGFQRQGVIAKDYLKIAKKILQNHPFGRFLKVANGCITR